MFRKNLPLGDNLIVNHQVPRETEETYLSYYIDN